MNFDEMILEAAKSITAATSALVKAATAAQRELIDSGKISGTPLTSSDDGQWSEGLISAARLVAAATHSLVESANAFVQGNFFKCPKETFPIIPMQASFQNTLL